MEFSGTVFDTEVEPTLRNSNVRVQDNVPEGRDREKVQILKAVSGSHVSSVPVVGVSPESKVALISHSLALEGISTQGP